MVLLQKNEQPKGPNCFSVMTSCCSVLSNEDYKDLLPLCVRQPSLRRPERSTHSIGLNSQVCCKSVNKDVEGRWYLSDASRLFWRQNTSKCDYSITLLPSMSSFYTCLSYGRKQVGFVYNIRNDWFSRLTHYCQASIQICPRQSWNNLSDEYQRHRDHWQLLKYWVIFCFQAVVSQRVVHIKCVMSV